ncbi:MAG: hypothetical protein AMR96_07145 [Candidatus Adiutrix intracellularis]|nr:MAG: hypothetical protein AMR96_07145 [Candidatus Adiutrix intracellularis]
MSSISSSPCRRQNTLGFIVGLGYLKNELLHSLEAIATFSFDDFDLEAETDGVDIVNFEINTDRN